MQPSPIRQRVLQVLTAGGLIGAALGAHVTGSWTSREATPAAEIPTAAATSPARVTATLVRQPYLQKVGANSATVVWASVEPGPAEVRFTSDANSTTRVAAATTTLFTAAQTGMGVSYYQHEATLTGLASATTYNYDVFVGGVDATPVVDALTTAPALGTGTVSFVAFGDSGSGSSDQWQLAELIAGEFATGADLAIHTGDIVYPRGTYQLLQDRFFAVYDEWLRRRPIFFAVGNHEYYEQNAQPYLDTFAMPENGHDPQLPGYRERYYSFDYGSIHFISLDSDAFLGNTPRQQQLTWLVRDLEATTQPWRIVFMHNPAYGASALSADGVIRTTLQPILQRYGVQLVLAGHEHAYGRGVPWLEPPTAYSPVMHVVTGGGGASLNLPGPSRWLAFWARAYHYVRGTVRDCGRNGACSLTLAAVDSEGHTFDSFTLSLRDQQQDREPPVVDWLQPTPGAHVSGVATVSAAASDDKQVVKLDLWVDDELRLVDVTPPYEWSWDTKEELNGDRRLRLSAVDIAGRVTVSETRTVRVANSAPTVALRAPIWDQVFTGVPFRIRWAAGGGAAPLKAFRVEASSDGKTFVPLAGCNAMPAAARECLWSAPGPVSNKSVVRVTATDALGVAVSSSSPPFRITSGSTTLTVKFPDKPTTLAVGSTQSLLWNTGLNFSPLRVEMSRDGGTSWDALAPALLPLTTDLRWTVTEPLTSLGLIRISSLNTSLQDTSDAPFEIAPVSLAVTAPTAGTIWRHNTQATVKWTTNLGAYDRVNVRLSLDGGSTFPIVLAGSVDARVPSAKVTVPVVTTHTARVMVESLAHPEWRATGAVNFKILPP